MDLSTIEDLDDQVLLALLRQNYRKNQIYSATGQVLLAMNPYKPLNIYTKPIMQAYYNSTLVQPHIFSIVEQAYRDLEVQGDQTLIVSGESGSGKTETTKYALEYLTSRTNSSSKIHRLINAAGVVLEAFGNAKTLINDNSSRFGKRIKLVIENTIVGAEITTYLLEKSRVTHRSHGEKNFHIFYQLCAEHDLKISNDFIDTTFITDRDFDYSEIHKQSDLCGSENQGSADQHPSGQEMDDANSFSTSSRKRRCYKETLDSLIILGINDTEEIENVLLAIIHLGSLRFHTARSLKVVKDEHFSLFCRTMEIDEATFEDMLVTNRINVKNEVIDVPNTLEQSITIRNSIARLIYATLFDYLVYKINQSLYSTSTGLGISILDIFGFEVFSSNSLDQFCINWANEKIQSEFVRRVFIEKQAQYKEDGILEQLINYKDNEKCLQDIEKPCGVADLIEEESFSAWGSAENLGIKLENLFQDSNHIRVKLGEMTISHYVGDVKYRLNGFIDKNKEVGDILLFTKFCEKFSTKGAACKFAVGNKENSNSLREGSRVCEGKQLVSVSTDTGHEDSLGIYCHETMKLLELSTNNKTLSNANSMDSANKASSGIKMKREKAGVVKYFKESMNTLFDSINKTQIKYVRCIKPNSTQTGGVFEDKLVFMQLKACGIIETINICKNALPQEIDKEVFYNRYNVIRPLNVNIREGKRKVYLDTSTAEQLETRLWLMHFRCHNMIKKYIRRWYNKVTYEKENKRLENEGNASVTREVNPSMECVTALTAECDKTHVFERDEEVTGSYGIVEDEGLHDGVQAITSPDCIKENSPLVSDECGHAEPYGDPQQDSSKSKDRLIKEYENTIRELSSKLEQYKKFCCEPCKNCKSLELKYKFQSEALKRKNLVELELERYKIKVDELENALKSYRAEEEETQTFSSSQSMFSCLIQLYLEYSPAFSSSDVPQEELLSLAHSIFYAVKRLINSGHKNNCNTTLTELISMVITELKKKLSLFERNIHKVVFVLANLVELKSIIAEYQTKNATGGNTALHVSHEAIPDAVWPEECIASVYALLDEVIELFFKHTCELQKNAISEFLPSTIIEHQPIKDFKCSESYLKKFFKPPSIEKLIRVLEYLYYQMVFFYVPERYILESINFLLKTIDVLVFNGILVKQKFLSFNRGVQMNYNINEVEKFCLSIGYHEGIHNLGHISSVIKLINHITAKSTKDKILEECPLLSMTQLCELASKFIEAVPFDCERRGDKFLNDPCVVLPKYSKTVANKFVYPRYLPSKSLASILKTIK